MIRFKLKRFFLKFIYMLTLILLFYLYMTLILNTSMDIDIMNEINKKYSNNKINFKDNFLQVDKIVTKEENNIIENTIINVDEKVDKNNEKRKLIYIYNTHDTEKYNLPYSNDYSITPDVRLASFILKDYLHEYDIESYVQTKSINDYLKKHNLNYKGSYEASREYMKEVLKEDDYKILIDIHRDSVKYKYTLYEKDNKKYARIMFVLATKNKNYKKNEVFVNLLNDKFNKYYKGLSRGIMVRKDVIFNQDMSPYAILIELGGVDNTLEEINNTLEVLAYILNEIIKEESI